MISLTRRNKKSEASKNVSPSSTRYDSLLSQTNYAIDQIRDVAKWFIASIGAVASLLVVGVQLTAIGKVSSYHAVIAGMLVLIAIGAAGTAIWKLTTVLLPQITTRAEVVDAAQEGEFGIFVKKHSFLLAGKLDVMALAAAQEKAVKASNQPGAGEKEENEARRLTEALNLLVPFGSYFSVRKNFKNAQRWLLSCAFVGGVAIVVYARVVGSA